MSPMTKKKQPTQPALIETPKPRSPHRSHAITITSTSGTIHWQGQDLEIERVGWILFNPDGTINRLQTQFTQKRNETGWDICTCEHMELAHNIEKPRLGACTFKDCTCQQYQHDEAAEEER